MELDTLKSTRFFVQPPPNIYTIRTLFVIQKPNDVRSSKSKDLRVDTSSLSSVVRNCHDVGCVGAGGIVQRDNNVFCSRVVLFSRGLVSCGRGLCRAYLDSEGLQMITKVSLTANVTVLRGYILLTGILSGAALAFLVLSEQVSAWIVVFETLLALGSFTCFYAIKLTGDLEALDE